MQVIFCSNTVNVEYQPACNMYVTEQSASPLILSFLDVIRWHGNWCCWSSQYNITRLFHVITHSVSVASDIIFSNKFSRLSSLWLYKDCGKEEGRLGVICSFFAWLCLVLPFAVRFLMLYDSVTSLALLHSQLLPLWLLNPYLTVSVLVSVSSRLYFTCTIQVLRNIDM